MSQRNQTIERHIPALRRYAFGLTRNAADADDLVQSSLEKALAGWGFLRSESSTKSWLFTILYHQFISGVRRRARNAEGGDDGLADIHARDGNPEDALELADVLAAVGRLAPERRTVLLLVTVEGFTYDEAARIAGVPVGTVMSRLSRARTELRAALDRQPRPALRRVK